MIAGFFVQCRNTPSSAEMEQLLKEAEDMSVEEAQNVIIRYTDSAVLKAIVKAPLLVRYPKKKEAYTEMPKGLSAVFYDGAGQEDSRLSAAYGINYETKKLIKLTDSVRVFNRKGEELRSEELYWDQKEKRIYTNTFVRIIRNGETLRGDGFESNENFTKYRILKPAGPVTVQDNFLEDEEAQ
ncbi:MAG: LPS export ABC transporter periplasmic protein LptC [Bacteroidia bacterium]|nr:LPS export ABC transporter periplasmic protein LptC [Bacteroidia bacterium]